MDVGKRKPPLTACHRAVPCAVSRLAQIVAILLAAMIIPAHAENGWKFGRATFYKETMHYGSCGYGYLDPDKGTGWDIGALTDSTDAFAGSCGRCYEVRCKPASFSDGYGNQLGRDHVCSDESQSIVITITDQCPCEHANAYSNRRWCCGDMPHIDLSEYAFEKLAGKEWGVMGILFREVPCDHRPENPAPKPDNPAPGIAWEPHYAPNNCGAGEACTGYNPYHPYNPGDPNNVKNDPIAPTLYDDGEEPAVQAFDGPGQGSAPAEPRLIFGDGWFAEGWFDASWSTEGFSYDGSGGSQCAKVKGDGALSFATKDPAFSGVKFVHLCVKDNGSVASLAVQLLGDSVSGKRAKLADMAESYRSGDYACYDVDAASLVDSRQQKKSVQAFDGSAGFRKIAVLCESEECEVCVRDVQLKS
ncbi:unnamed protein product [Pedinophyceae sp. YPF-701]|nr:unnamed protein product [Pedinophyceae sp. YPF-701]